MKPTNGSKANLANLLKHWRNREGFTQEQAAQELGVPLGTLQGWEQDRRHPRGFAMKAILDRLK